MKTRSRFAFDYDRPPRRTIFAQGRLSAALKDALRRFASFYKDGYERDEAVVPSNKEFKTDMVKLP